MKEKNKKLNYKNILNIIGYIIVVLSFLYIINSFRKLDINLLKENINFFWIPWITILIIVYAVTVFLYSLSWKYIIEIFSEVKLSIRFISSIYLKANVAKYLPGNVFHFAGRHMLVRKKGVKDKDLVFSNIMEIICLLIFSGIIIFIGFVSGIITIPEIIKEKINLYFLIIAGIVFLILVIGYIIYMKIKKKTINWKLFVKKKSILNILKITLLYFFIFIILGLVLYSVTLIVLNIDLNINDIIFVICSFSLAWVLGYIVPGAPGGLGIREAVIIIMLSSKFTETGALLSSVILRGITILGDVLGFFIGNILNEKRDITIE